MPNAIVSKTVKQNRMEQTRSIKIEQRQKTLKIKHENNIAEHTIIGDAHEKKTSKYLTPYTDNSPETYIRIGSNRHYHSNYIIVRVYTLVYNMLYCRY